MTQYINKAAVVAEIESYKNSFCDRNGYLEDCETNGLAYDTLCELENSIDTLEVKEDVVLNDTFANSLEISRHGNSRNGGNGDLEEAAYRYGNCFKKHFDLASMAFIKGAEWQKERMLNNAIEREVKVDAGGYPYIDATELYDYDKDKPIAKKGDKVKLIIIKDE